MPSLVFCRYSIRVGLGKFVSSCTPPTVSNSDDEKTRSNGGTLPVVGDMNGGHGAPFG
jgi:hypothetical protein